VGKHDGVVRGKRYFTCEENHGLFVKIHKIIPLGHAGGKVGIKCECLLCRHRL
jgi:hypothetical protein